ncbi:MAG: UbiH/UbiF family hydroxylase [Methylobacillus sp.]|jgi:ubiquinone biosynthesis UbiH/UbiF/VisC/COQ6 family hydroxylase|nr:UbiH/UbiF family hydroxylase [Methylobacillus sp.]
MKVEYDVIIIGGGLVGAATALALKDAGLRIALVEAGAEPVLLQDESWDSRIYAISPGNVRFLTELGAWNRQDLTRVAPIEAMHIWSDGGARLEFSADEASVETLGTIVESRLMQQALWARVQMYPQQIDLYNAARCQHLIFSLEKATLSLEGTHGRDLTAKLIIGADGGNSWSRTQAGIGVNTHDYKQLGVVANFECVLPPRNIARQWFRRDGILAWLPLPGNRMSMVWSTDPVHAAELMALPADALCAKVAEAGGHVLGDLQLITPPAAFPLRLQNAETLVKPRFALVGDAGHLVHPMAGQGVNLGFHDAAKLAEVLRERGAQSDVGDYGLLRRYERARKLDIAAMQTMTTGLHALFGSDLPGAGWLRNTGMNLTNSQPWLKRRLMAHAMI